MFTALKNLKEKYENSSSWGEFFAFYLIDLDDIYKRLEGKTEIQQIEILKRALEEQTKKTKELIEEVSKQREQIKELENSNRQKDLEMQKLKKSQSLIGLKTKIEKLGTSINVLSEALVEVSFKNKVN